MPQYEYHVELIHESGVGSLLLGQAGTSKKKSEKVLNDLGADGWRLVTMERVRSRLWLFWGRETLVATLVREL